MIPSRLQRYVLWEIIPVIGICTVALTAIFFLGLSASFTREGVSVVQIYYVIPYILMLSLPYALPASFLLASVLVFGRLSSRHEIDAMRANGVNVNHIIIPPLALALVVCCATFFLNHYFFPWTLQRVTQLRNKLINDVAETVGQSAKNGFQLGPYYIYVGGSDPKDHSLKSVALIQFADEIPSRFIWAKRGVWTRVDENNAALTLEDGVMMEPTLSEHLKEDEKRPMVYFKKITRRIPLDPGGGPSLKPKYMPLGMLLDCIRERGKTAAQTREELGPATRHPKTELWIAKKAFAEADQKCAAAEKVLDEKRGKLDETRSALQKLEMEVRTDQTAQEDARKRNQEARTSLADQAAYLAKLQADIQDRADMDATPEELAPLKDEAARIAERISQLTKRVEDSQKVLQGAAAVLQAADAQRQAAAAAFALAETEYKSAATDANAAADDRRRCAAVRDKLDGVEQWIDAVSEYHFRNAGSATCFIFMLIGIPLGILARRGSFTVALAISFCAVLFIHYPLMMVGETLASDGYLAPWIAEWMANAALGCIGLGLLIWGLNGEQLCDAFVLILAPDESERAHRSAVQRMPPVQPWEPGEIAICGHPLSPALDGHGGQICVRDQIAARLSRLAKSAEDRPVPRPWRDGNTICLPANLIHITQRDIQRCGGLENAGMRDDPKATAEHQFGDAECGWRSPKVLQPLSVFRVALAFFAVRVDENVDVRQDHSVPSMMSRSSDVQSRFTPGRTPLPRNVTKGSRFDGFRVARRLASSSRRASLITAPIFRPSRAARCLTSANRASSIFTVVRIGLPPHHHSISIAHHDASGKGDLLYCARITRPARPGIGRAAT